MSAELDVASTILQQLGGRQFIAMTGSRSFVGTDRSLAFRVGSGAKDGITHTRVTLEPSDTYRVEFLSIRGTRVHRTVSQSDGVYCDMLQEVFTEATGLYTRL